MASKEEAEDSIRKMGKGFLLEENKKRFSNWTKSMQFTFTDLEVTFLMNVENGEPQPITEEALEKPDIHITSDSDTFVGILNGEISGMKAYTQGKMKVKGGMRDLLKLQKLM